MNSVLKGYYGRGGRTGVWADGVSQRHATISGIAQLPSVVCRNHPAA